MIFGNLRRSLLLTNVLVMASILAALGTGILLVMDRLLVGQETATVQADAQRALVERGELSSSEFQSRHTSYTSGTFYVLWDTAGNATFNPSGAPEAPLARAAAAALAGRGGTTQVELEPGQPALVTSSLISDDGQVSGVLQAGRSLVPVRSVESEAALVALVAGLLALLVILGAGWFLTERALIPVRLALERQVRFTADASHELRTPLTIIDTGLQVLRRNPRQTIANNQAVVDSISSETRRMARLVGDLLTLARVDSGQAEIQLESADLTELVATTGRDLEALAESRGAHLLVRSEAKLAGHVDPERLRQVLVILVDNALRHGAPGDTVELNLERAGEEIRIEVSDHGPGIPPDQREKVFEPFHRLAGDRTDSGAGLGLAIARWIVRAHRGTIKLLDNKPGLRVRVSLPPGGGEGANQKRAPLRPRRAVPNVGTENPAAG
ncbi:MAG TPA: HAMP domain-containing sensor histidine kinase [Candidatus Dormibacteraeota bacterium]|nr:HAMP domain-containing sensor histidine kinase [Candidatus Dormibacteraeota bacterium]